MRTFKNGLDRGSADNVDVGKSHFSDYADCHDIRLYSPACLAQRSYLLHS